MSSFKLKWLSLALFSLLFIACGGDEDPTDPTTDPKEEEAQYPEEYFCDDLFTTGDYSHLCAFDAAIPEVFSSAPGLTSKDCAYILSTIDEQAIYMSVTFRSSVETTLGVFDGYDIPFQVAGSADGVNDLVIEDVSGVGDGARLFKYKDDDGVNQKFMITVNSNAIFFLVTSHEGGLPQPCHANKDEMVKFMQEVLENL